MSDSPKYVSNEGLQLELKAMRSEFRLWLIAAVVANSTLAHISLPPAVGFTGAGLMVAALITKVVLFK